MKLNAMKLIKPIVFSILLGITIYYFIHKIQTANRKVKAPTAINGILDASKWDFSKKGFIKLDGIWDFYWQNLYSPSDIGNYSRINKYPPNHSFQKIPSIWSSYVFENQKLPGTGYATYRLRIKIKNTNEVYALKILDISTANQIWLDGRLISKTGNVGKSKEEMAPSFKSKIIEFKPENEIIEIIFQVSNYYHTKGGLWNYIEFGYSENIEETREAQTGFEFFMFGSLSIMAFYHFGLYALRKKDKSTFYFGAVCLIISLRILLTGERFLFALFDDPIFWTTLIKLEFMTVYLSTPFFILFFESIYPEDSQKRLAKFSLLAGLLFSFAAIFTDTTISTGFVTYFQVLLLCLILYIFYVLIIINIRKREGAVWIALGLIIFLGTLANDLLYLNNLIYTGFLFPIGLFVFIFSQSFILSMRFSKAFATVESMTEKLLTLDKLKDDFLANTSHELRTPLNGIIGIAESMLDDKAETFSADTIQNLSLIVSSGRRLSSLVNDIIDFSKLKNHEITLQIRDIDLKQIVDLVIKLSEPLIAE